MPNPFDRFDTGNPFDRFDAISPPPPPPAESGSLTPQAYAKQLMQPTTLPSAVARQGLLGITSIGKGVVNAALGPFADALASAGNIAYGAMTGDLSGPMLRVKNPPYMHTGEALNKLASDVGLPNPQTTPEKISDLGVQLATGFGLGKPINDLMMNRMGLLGPKGLPAAPPRKTPSVEELRAAKDRAYKAVETAGETVPKEQISGLADNIGAELASGKYRPDLHPRVTKVLSLIRKQEANPATTIRDLDILKQTIRAKARGSNIQDQLIGQAARELDKFTMNLEGSDTLGVAKAAYMHLKKAEQVQKLIDAADKEAARPSNTRSIGEILKDKFASFASSETRLAQFSPEEKDAITAVAKTGNLSRLGKILRGPIVAGGYAVGGPHGAMVVRELLGATNAASRAAAASELIRNGGLLQRPPPQTPLWLPNTIGTVGPMGGLLNAQ